MQLTNLTIKF